MDFEADAILKAFDKNWRNFGEARVIGGSNGDSLKVHVAADGRYMMALVNGGSGHDSPDGPLLLS